MENVMTSGTWLDDGLAMTSAMAAARDPSPEALRIRDVVLTVAGDPGRTREDRSAAVRRRDRRGDAQAVGQVPGDLVNENGVGVPAVTVTE